MWGHGGSTSAPVLILPCLPTQPCTAPVTWRGLPQRRAARGDSHLHRGEKGQARDTSLEMGGQGCYMRHGKSQS